MAVPRPEALLPLFDFVDSVLPADVSAELCADLSGAQLADLLDVYMWATRTDSALLSAVSARLRVD